MIPTLTLLVGLLFATPAPAQITPPAPPFVLTISSAKASYTPGEAVEIIALLHDVQPKVIYMYDSALPAEGGYTHYNLSAVGPHSQEAPRTAYSNWASHQISVCSAGCGGKAIEHGGTFSDTIMVTRFFDLTAPGKYSIQVSARWANLPTVTSNVLEITVVQPR